MTFLAKVEKAHKLQCNRSCFDCKEKGTNYVVLNFGIFVCSSCSGLHRELCHKVKGLGMSNFSEKDAEMIEQWGN